MDEVGRVGTKMKCFYKVSSQIKISFGVSRDTSDMPKL